ncbi:cytochrome P450 4B1-like isoform X1 [Crassostrea angulata]|uniref:cytochrome P450 4B1-like isoform X1 n=1 Tax=Magallana angulata TaxID=2784310 RepID=UPI0022B098DD|nr:cytochrome P450 4B1-like isoform X1 [Crassostrea angulata]
MAGMLVASILAIIVVAFTHLIVKTIKVKYTFWGFPESIYDKHWLLGHLPHYKVQGYLGKHYMDKLVEWTEKYPKMFLTWIGPATVRVMLNHPDSVKQILRTADPKPIGYGQIYSHAIPWLGEGLVIAGGARWKRSRRLLSPAFHFDILKPYVKVYKSCTDHLVQNIQTFADKKESVEVFGLVSACTLDIILQCAFSHQADCQNLGADNQYSKTVYSLTKEWMRRNASPWLYPDSIYFKTEKGKQFKCDCDYVHKIAEDVIRQRKALLKNEDISNRKYLDFLDIILTAKDEDGQGMSMEDIRSEVDTFLFAGHDTTASAISWILYSLAEHPEHQMKCQEEIDRVVSETESGELEWNDLGRLEYLTQCIKEGMRLHSPVPSILRENQAPITIDNHVIPAGSCVAISIYCLHHNPAVWGQNHMDFRPDRFTKENIRKMDPFAYCPFSAGPRNCIGQQFAMAEEKIVLSTLLRRFNFSVDKSHQIERMQAAVMKTKTGIKLFASPR